jgi:L-aspartate oxidase
MVRPVIIVGAGIAGLSTALSIRRQPVLLLTRGQLSRSGATRWAQGGIAASWLPEDSPEHHARDTFSAGAGVNDPVAVDVLTSQARETIDWLEAQGVEFDRGPEGPALCLEGGHSHRRILHAGGDSSGRYIVDALSERVVDRSDIACLEHAHVDRLLMRGHRVCGVRVRMQDGEVRRIEGAEVVLATGGIGGLFQWTSNPPECDGAGLALGIEAGAEPRDLEFVQFHPTVLKPGNSDVQHRLPLISEAVRGAGAILVDDTGRRIMAGEHPLGDLAPRDIVARRVWRSYRDGNSVFLDARRIDSEWPQRFPTIFAICMTHGLDPRRDLIPVVPAAHFHMGGLKADLEGRTSVPGLRVVGEVACNRVHGANRLASNSLLEGAIFGRRLGLSLDDALSVAADDDAQPLREIGSDALTGAALSALRSGIWSTLGPEREHDAMQVFADRIGADPALARSREGIVALAILRSAIARQESVGAHYRRDTEPAIADALA